MRPVAPARTRRYSIRGPTLREPEVPGPYAPRTRQTFGNRRTRPSTRRNQSFVRVTRRPRDGSSEDFTYDERGIPALVHTAGRDTGALCAGPSPGSDDPAGVIRRAGASEGNRECGPGGPSLSGDGVTGLLTGRISLPSFVLIFLRKKHTLRSPCPARPSPTVSRQAGRRIDRSVVVFTMSPKQLELPFQRFNANRMAGRGVRVKKNVPVVETRPTSLDRVRVPKATRCAEGRSGIGRRRDTDLADPPATARAGVAGRNNRTAPACRKVPRFTKTRFFIPHERSTQRLVR
jgi:hypothetical protein